MPIDTAPSFKKKKSKDIHLPNESGKIDVRLTLNPKKKKDKINYPNLILGSRG